MFSEFNPCPKPEKQPPKQKKSLKRAPLKKKVTKIAKVTKKRARQLREYTKKREKHLQDHPNCERCLQPATDLHHKMGRIGDLLTDERFFLSLCAECHQFVTVYSKEAIEQGYSLKRNVKKI